MIDASLVKCSTSYFQVQLKILRYSILYQTNRSAHVPTMFDLMQQFIMYKPNKEIH